MQERIFAQQCNNPLGLTDVMFRVRGTYKELYPQKLESPYYKHLDPDGETDQIISVGDSYKISQAASALGVTKEILQSMRAEWIEKNRPHTEKIWAKRLDEVDDDF